MRSLRFALRRLLRSRAFTLASVATLMLGIGATTAVFAVVNAVLLRPLPYGDPERLVSVSHSLVISGLSKADNSDAVFLFYRRHNRVFSRMGAYQAISVNVGAVSGAGPSSDTDAERVVAARVTADVLPALRVSPRLGRPFSEEDDQPNSAPVVLLGERLWGRKYGADPGMVGRRLVVDGVSHEVVGIMAADFRFPGQETELWVPMRFDPGRTESAMFDYQVLGRLDDGATAATAAADLQALLPRVPEEFPGRMTRASIEQVRMQAVVQPLRDVVVGDIGRVLWVVLGAVGFVLAIACANVANLFLVRAEARQREVAVQRALGASPGVILQAFVAEALVIATAGGALGVLAASAGLDALRVLGGSLDIPRLAEVSLDFGVLAVAAACTAGATLFVAGVAALHAGAAPVSLVLTSISRSATAGRQHHRIRHALVVAQVALALVLVVGSGLMARSVWRLRSVQPGFEPAQALSFRLALPPATYPTADASVQLFARAVDDLGTIAGVEGAGAISTLPLDEVGKADTAVWIEDRPLASGQLPSVHPVAYATPGYFKAAGIPFLSGRRFERPDPPRVTPEAIVSRAFAERYWPEASPIGKRVRIFGAGPWYTVVGVVGSVRGSTLAGPPDPMVYFPILPPTADPRWSPRDLAFVVRTGGSPTGVASAAREIIRGIDPSLPIYRVRPLTEIVTRATARLSFTFTLLACASAVALLLGAVGLYGVMAYVVSLRTREMGIRLALGAQPGELRRMVSRQGLTVAAFGVVVGLACAVVLVRFLASLLFDVSPRDPVVLATATTVLLVVSVAASWLPARRAAAVDPAVTLKAE